MGFLSNSPQGFTNAVKLLNQLPQGVLAEMCQDVAAFLQYRAGFINVDEHQMNISCSCQSTPVPSAQECINALTFVFRSAAEHQLSWEQLTEELKSSMQWSEAAITVVGHVWKEEASNVIDVQRRMLNIGQLASMEWKLGVSMSSSSCRALNSPYVTLMFTVVTDMVSGTTKQYSVELDMQQFQNFSTQLREMSSLLETA
ncbi:COMM domain-containing protein 6-like [Dysidea avara]|uniref:COMM domain-containing protein 6-like n=1 Tax=Dysidea avara TaxID=196820 RepID=UPI00332BCB74